ncbi:MAG: M20 family metallopeptidase [Chloroflexota bacterium]|nr:M20 family metallopeptidase [Chloroflexota bacterium]
MTDTSDMDWLASTVDVEEAVSLTAHLVAHPSYSGDESAVQRAIAGWFTSHDIPVEIQPVDGDRANVLARVDRGPGPTLLLTGHADTVPAVEGWSSDPWTARREGDRLYGLGACDMKAGLAAAMLATRDLARRSDWRGTVLFASVVDEEAYSLGARALIAAGLRADACVVTESAWRPCLGAVGKVLVRVDVEGKAAHASWPDDGVNAAVEAARFVAGLDALPVGRHPRMVASRCVLSVRAGEDRYAMTVPEHARVVVSRMIVPGETGEGIVAELRDHAASLRSPAHFSFTLDPPYYPPWETSPDHPFVTEFARAYRAETGDAPTWAYTGFGDANLFAGELNIPTVHFGPHGANFHRPDEWVDIPTIGATVRVLLRLSRELLAPVPGSGWARHPENTIVSG